LKEAAAWANLIGMISLQNQQLYRHGKLKMAEIKLEDILDKKPALYQLTNRLNREHLIKELSPYYCEGPGRLDIPIHVIVGFHYLKDLENESDESVGEKLCENPYWQSFCDFETFQHQLPSPPTTLVKWRKRIGEKGVEKWLSHTIDTTKREALLPEQLLKMLM
jgi:transposase, IS5 family